METVMEMAATTDAPPRRTMLDRFIFVAGTTTSVLVRLAVFMLTIFAGLMTVPQFILTEWNGSPAATAGIMLGLVLFYALVELTVWAIREAFEWLFAFIEVLWDPRELVD